MFPIVWTLVSSILTTCVSLLIIMLIVRQLQLFLLLKKLPKTLSPRVPLLGNALAYKNDPVQFAAKAAAQGNGIFTIDLSGTAIVLVEDEKALAKYHNAREHILSARTAVSDFGFKATLGEYATHDGTDLHRKLLVSKIVSKSKLPGYIAQLVQANAIYLRKHANSKVELFAFLRKLTLASYARVFMGASMADNTQFIDDFMLFQDDLEDATAQAVVLPPFLAWFALRKVTQQRRAIIKTHVRPFLDEVIAKHDPMAPLDGHPSYVSLVLHDYYTRTPTILPASSKFKSLAVNPPSETRRTEMCELLIGFLFASHKNIALASAQTVLQLHADQVSLLNVTDEQCVDAVARTLNATAHVIGSMRKVLVDDFALTDRQGVVHLIPQGTYVGAVHHGFQSEGKRDKQMVFSGGVHACPGRMLAIQHTAAIVRLWCECVQYDPDLANQNRTNPLDFTRATLAQRLRPVHTTLTLVEKK